MRDFPDIFGHNDEFIAATVVIVLITIVIMGGATEHLLRSLGIQMGVDEDNYMTEWYKHRRLNGYFHSFGTCYSKKCPNLMSVLMNPDFFFWFNLQNISISTVLS